MYYDIRPVTKYVCHTCGKIESFENIDQAYQAGWDVIDTGNELVYFCGKCPSAPFMVEQFKKGIHA